uniref:Uncharacterized protein n=1 Tax=Tanacetum cinerariifolium TaxID=118510 RepID=A0A6L2LY70_TANCI|nr:hypothetical protein [Tanacetum cinerariifolium]
MKPPTPDRAWNKTLPATHESIQPWISDVAKQADSCTSFNDLMDTPLDFSAFLMNRLKVDTLTPELLVGPTYELMKGSCKSLVELKFFLEEVYKETTDQLDSNNPEGQYRKYTTFVTKTKAADYGHIKWLKTWYLIQCGVKHWSAMINMLYGKFLIGGANINSSMDLQSTWSLLRMSTLNVESSLSLNFKSSNGITTSIWIGSLRLTNLTVDERFAFNVSLRMFTRSIVIQRRVEDLQ